MVNLAQQNARGRAGPTGGDHGKCQELADQARAGAFDAARRTIKVQEDVLGAVENYQNKVAAEVRTPWSLVKANYDLAKTDEEFERDFFQALHKERLKAAATSLRERYSPLENATVGCPDGDGDQRDQRASGPGHLCR